MDEITFKQITATATGAGGTTGHEMQLAWEHNFNKVKTLLTNIINIIAFQVSSEDIKQFKVDTTTTPHKVYFSLDDLDVLEPQWTLLSTSFSDILGNPTDNIALKELLDSKASASTVQSLSNDVATNDEHISDLSDRLDPVETDLATAKRNISDLQAGLTMAVKTEQGSHLYLRLNNSNQHLEYSSNGVTWHDISDSFPTPTPDVRWDELKGDPTDSAVLLTAINDVIDQVLEDANYVDKEYVDTHLGSLEDHVVNFNNPHNVTIEQLGFPDLEQRLSALEQSQAGPHPLAFSDYLASSTDNEVQYFISSVYFNNIGTFTSVATLSGSTTYTTVDGYELSVENVNIENQTVTINDEPVSIGEYYLVEDVTADDVTTYEVKYNSELHDYLKTHFLPTNQETTVGTLS